MNSHYQTSDDQTKFPNQSNGSSVIQQAVSQRKLAQLITQILAQCKKLSTKFIITGDEIQIQEITKNFGSISCKTAKTKTNYHIIPKTGLSHPGLNKHVSLQLNLTIKAGCQPMNICPAQLNTQILKPPHWQNPYLGNYL